MGFLWWGEFEEVCLVGCNDVADVFDSDEGAFYAFKSAFWGG